MAVVVGDGYVGGKLVDALHPTVEAMELAGLRQIARASADRLDHAREVIPDRAHRHGGEGLRRGGAAP